MVVLRSPPATAPERGSELYVPGSRRSEAFGSGRLY